MFTDFGRDLQKIPPFENVECRRCGTVNRVHALSIYINCSACGRRSKLRGLGPTLRDELLDIVDDVLEWARDDENWVALEQRRDVLRNLPRDEDDEEEE